MESKTTLGFVKRLLLLSVGEKERETKKEKEESEESEERGRTR